MNLYVYSNPNQMDGYKKNAECHKYTDDVALCYAESKEAAIEKFSLLYNPELLVGHVREVTFNCTGVYICTDY